MEAISLVKELERRYKYIMPSALIRVRDIEITEETIQKEVNKQRLKMVEWLINNKGQADPIYVKLSGSGWILLLGLEELEVFRRKGIEMIEAKIVEGEKENVITTVIKISESRRSMNAIELAEALEELKEKTKLTWNEVAEVTGLSREYISRLRQIKNCEYEDIKQLVKERKISIENALKEIRRRRKEERGEPILPDDVIEDWEQQPYQCPLCSVLTNKADTVRICKECYRKIVHKQTIARTELDAEGPSTWQDYFIEELQGLMTFYTCKLCGFRVMSEEDAKAHLETHGIQFDYI